MTGADSALPSHVSEQLAYILPSGRAERLLEIQHIQREDVSREDDAL